MYIVVATLIQAELSKLVQKRIDTIKKRIPLGPNLKGAKSKQPLEDKTTDQGTVVGRVST